MRKLFQKFCRIINEFHRRHKFYERCQQIVDDLHDRVKSGEFMDEAACKKEYGKDDYNALMHEISKNNSKIDHKTMTQAMEWMHKSRYFLWLDRQESFSKWHISLTLLSVIAAIASACIAYRSLHSDKPSYTNISIYSTTKNHGNCHEELKEKLSPPITHSDNLNDINGNDNNRSDRHNQQDVRD